MKSWFHRVIATVARWLDEAAAGPPGPAMFTGVSHR